MRKSFLPVFASAIVFFIASASISLSAQHGKDWKLKVSPSLIEQARNGEPVPFLILMAEQADVRGAKQMRSKDAKGRYVYEVLRETAAKTQKGIVSYLDGQHIPHHPLTIVNAIRTEGTLAIVQSIASRQDVARVIANPPVSFAKPVEWGVDPGGSRSLIEWGIDMINANDVWDMGYTGQGIVVGGEDTGYEWNHPALKNKYRGYNAERDTVDHNYNWHDAIHGPDPNHADTINPCGYDTQEPCDDWGHGTHTMGTMIGSEGDNQIGVAPDAQWCACRNMERGYGTPFTYIECFEWFLAPTDLNNENPDPSKAPHVINNSWGCPPVEGCDSSNYEIMNMVVNNLRAAGIVVVVSAGNDGSGCSSVYTPAAIFEGSFSVGATRSNDTIAGYSSRGPVLSDKSNRLKPNVSAPGSGVRSSVPGGGYDFSSGTSMAGPHVAGLVALMISANPELAGQVEVIESIIESTAVPKTTDQQCGDIPGSEVPNNTYGFGRVDALAAVEAAIALIETSVGDEHQPPGIKVYPNPVNNLLYVELQQASGPVVFEILDMQGRHLFQEQWEASGKSVQAVDVSLLPDGIYIYSMTHGGRVFQGKFVSCGC